MSSWSMVTNKENWLPWHIKDCLNFFLNRKSPKGAQSLGLVKFQVPSPQRVKALTHTVVFIVYTLIMWTLANYWTLILHNTPHRNFIHCLSSLVTWCFDVYSFVAYGSDQFYGRTQVVLIIVNKSSNMFRKTTAPPSTISTGCCLMYIHITYNRGLVQLENVTTADVTA